MRVALMIAACLISIVLGNPVDAGIPWQTDLQTAHQQAKATGKLLLVHFYSDQCVWCDRLEAGAFQDPRLQQAMVQDFIPVKIHGVRNSTIASHFGVNLFPTDVIVDVSGTVHGRASSPQDPTQYIAMLSRSLVQSGRGAQLAATPSAPMPPGPAAGTMPSAQPAFAPPATTVGYAPTGNPPGGFAVPGVPPADRGFAVPGGAMAANPTLGAPMAAAPISSAPEPELGLDGFCPVTVIEKKNWVAGNRQLGVIHLGQVFLFADEASQKKFLADPFRYAPVMSGIDIVQFFDNQAVIKGQREHAFEWNGHIYLFTDDASADRFYANFKRYETLVEGVNQRIAMEAAAAGLLR